MEEGQAVESSTLANGEAASLVSLNGSDDHEDSSSKDVSCWADSDEEADGASYLNGEWNRRREQFYNTGYRDGISAGRNDAAQDGFNHGFKDSVLAGYKWGIVRGITSALAHIPNELKAKLVESDEIRREFSNLCEAVDSIGTEDALKRFHDDIQKTKSAQQSKSLESGSSLTHQSCSEQSGLEDYFEKLEIFLKKSPVVDLHLDLSENRHHSH